MYIDLQSTFSGTTDQFGVKTGQAVTATALSTNTLDLRQSNLPVLANEAIYEHDLYLMVVAQTAVTAAGAATVTITLETDSDAALVTSPTVHFTSVAIPKATMVAGYVCVATQLPSSQTYERYMAVRYTVATGPLTAGNFLAFLTPDIPVITTYAGGFTIDV